MVLILCFTCCQKDIGGLGPELAEDHSTTLLMNSNGWRGVHPLDAIAHDDGPASFADAMVQEFQWSRSLAILLLTLSPKTFPTLPWGLKLQFAFAQLWFPLTGLIVFTGFFLPILAFITKQPMMNISFLDFLWRFQIMSFATLLPVIYIKRTGTFRPQNGKIVSWESTLFHMGVFHLLRK